MTWVYPTAVPYVTSKYGMRWHPTQHKWKLHAGTDYRGNSSTELYAPTEGVVVAYTRNHPTGGNWLQIRTDDGYLVGFSHMDRFNLPSNPIGYRVRRGTVLGYAGSTGSVTAAHLHYSIKKNGAYMDPDKFLRSIGATTIDYAPSGGGDDDMTPEESNRLKRVERILDILLAQWGIPQTGVWGELGEGARWVRDTNSRTQDIDERTVRIGEQNTHLARLMKSLDERVGRLGKQGTYDIRLQREALALLEEIKKTLVTPEAS